jgi:hypothetical protein
MTCSQTGVCMLCLCCSMTLPPTHSASAITAPISLSSPALIHTQNSSPRHGIGALNVSAASFDLNYDHDIRNYDTNYTTQKL